ncbi:MAG TPA: aminotransferase class V-fold PLP-dependent enzyme [Vicinamibacterales bacterium]|nr:aminotransferase class V-fold PLP-dependent enzyme [Vicinamibacterales bacterium]
MTPEEFRRFGHQLIDWIADYRERVGERPVMARTKPGAVKAQLPASPPEEPEPFDAVLADLDRIVMPGLSHWAHPRFFGYFPCNGDLSSVLGDYASTGLGVLGLAWQSSPALTEVEEVATDWLRQMLGLSDRWSGVIQDTASTSSLIAMISAREKTTSYALARGGLQAEPRPLVIYVSAHSHSSIEKAALLAGFGRDQVRVVAHDERWAMRPDALELAIGADRDAGRLPCAIVATTGTTTTTAVDPVEAIGAIARREGLWLHVDAAMAGSAMILPECRWMWAGIDQADSIVLNPHKWLGAAFDCSVYYVREPEHLVRVMSTNPSYLQTAADREVKNYRDWGIPLGRRFRALKLWFLIREQGVSGLQARLRRDLENAQWLAGEIQSTPAWRVLNPVVLQTLCVRHEPPGLEGEELDAHTRRWCDRINQSGEAYLTPATLDGRWMVRVSIGSLTTEREHVADLWAAMQREARRA